MKRLTIETMQERLNEKGNKVLINNKFYKKDVLWCECSCLIDKEHSIWKARWGGFAYRERLSIVRW